MGRLEGKTALVTGAGTGIGRACMVLFAKEGAKVFGISRTQANLDETLRLVEAENGSGSVFSADLSDPERAEASVEQMLDEYGRIDILPQCRRRRLQHQGLESRFDGSRSQHAGR